MRLTASRFVALVAIAIATTAQPRSAAAGPVEKRADSTFSAASIVSTAALVETAGIAAVRPTITSLVPTLSPNASSSLVAGNDVPVCRDGAAKLFCLPANNTDLYFGESYYVTWDPKWFKPNSTFTIRLNWSNDTSRNVWESGPLLNRLGATTVVMQHDWFQGDANLTFFAVLAPALIYNGPTVQLKARPSTHLQPQEPAESHSEMGLKVGLPICLGFAALLVVGLAIGLRKQKRRAGLGDVMGRRRGYGSRKSRWQRLGRGRAGKEDMRSQEHELLGSREYKDDPLPQHKRSRESSFDSAAGSPSADQPNVFKEEMERQKTGGRQ